MTKNIDNLKSSNYLICGLYGFNNLILRENKEYEVNDDIIKSFIISDDLKKVTVYLEDNVSYYDYKDDIQYFLYKLCFNLIVNTEVKYDIPTYSIEKISENGIIRVNENLVLQDTLRIIVDYPAEDIYEKIIQLPTKMKEHTTLYERLFKILHNPNNIAQFMSLYQFLMELLKGPKEHTRQKDVIEYLETNKAKYDFLEFSPTTKVGKSFDEDCFTYVRNKIAHCEETNDFNNYKELGSQITQKLIKDLIKVINDVIIDI